MVDLHVFLFPHKIYNVKSERMNVGLEFLNWTLCVIFHLPTLSYFYYLFEKLGNDTKTYAYPVKRFNLVSQISAKLMHSS